ncbi:E3 ubiquitin-protein ligase APD2-like protein [Drosera capensis]
MDEDNHNTVVFAAAAAPPPADGDAAGTGGGGAGSYSVSSLSLEAGIQIQDSEEAGVSGHDAEVNVLQENEGQPSNHHSHHHHRGRHLHQPAPPSSVSYRFNVPISDLSPGEMRDDVWSCLAVLVTFWFFAASMTLILGFYGSDELQLGPNCSRLITTNPIFVQSIKGQLEDQVSGAMLYGFHRTPPLDVETSWSETHSESVLANYHKASICACLFSSGCFSEWVYHLNMGTYINISYDVKSTGSSPLSLVIAQGPESLVEWLEDPSYPNSTLSWNTIYGSGKIEQKITSSATYYVAIGNLNSEASEVELNFTIKAVLYNTTRASFKCSLSHALVNEWCVLHFKVSYVPSDQAKDTDDGYAKISFGPRWATYFVGSGLMTIVILAVVRVSNMFQASHEDGARYGTIEVGQGSREPLLSPKDNDLLSWGSSYDSLSQDEDDLKESIQERKPQKEGDQANINPRHLCVICFDAPRDCFFLPCGHCAPASPVDQSTFSLLQHFPIGNNYPGNAFQVEDRL